MLHEVTYEKVEEIARLSEEARRHPQGMAADPRRGGPFGDRGIMGAERPLAPQPAADWQDAFQRYLHDLPPEALSEVIALYRCGHGDATTLGQAEEQLRRESSSPADRRRYLQSRADLASSLKRALRQI